MKRTIFSLDVSDFFGLFLLLFSILAEIFPFFHTLLDSSPPHFRLCILVFPRLSRISYCFSSLFLSFSFFFLKFFGLLLPSSIVLAEIFPLFHSLLLFSLSHFRLCILVFPILSLNFISISLIFAFLLHVSS